MRINHNHLGLVEGQSVILDEGFKNQSEVKIVSFSPLEMFAVVKADDEEWEVMTTRLSLPPIKIKHKLKCDFESISENDKPKFELLYCPRCGVKLIYNG